MRTLLNPFFIACAVLWGVNQLLEINGIYLWPLFGYLDDLVCFPLVLGGILTVQRVYFSCNSITLPFQHVIFAVVMFTVCFELVLPYFRAVYTADALDAIAYSAGALGFQVFINKPLVLLNKAYEK